MRRLAYEAADTGLLSPDLAAGIRRVKGAKRLGVRLGNWLSLEESRRLIDVPQGTSLRALRDRAILSVLLGCGLRRAELSGSQLEHLQRREGRWVVGNLIGKGRHLRTVPMPDWVKAAVDSWVTQAAISNGTLFRAIGKTGKPWADGFTPKVVWSVASW